MTKEVIFILDRSGSMNGLEADTIGGFNGLIAAQKEVEGAVNVSTILFDDAYETLHDQVALKTVSPLTNETYYVRGTTALLDAIGKTITTYAHRFNAKEKKPDSTMVVIMTDGYENASQEYSYSVVKSLVDAYQKEAGWEFLFLGANIDAMATGDQLGIRKDRAVNFHADAHGVKGNFAGVNVAMNEFRTSKSISKAWRKDIDTDYKSRK